MCRFIVPALLASLLVGCGPVPQPAFNPGVSHDVRFIPSDMTPETQATLDALDNTIANARYERAIDQLDHEARMNGF